ncbi:hypothetical protein ColLi_13464 [Colletotrichum liriopes]|uniref:Heterokaryon incompatibility protein n=1 Tax=Colletotrichum liriopes TaxID=708192 RepID=A0AA37M0L2_9PEZI|nr:hypothetical protein ColLi_13464 [Colletotrichum liriopes]
MGKEMNKWETTNHEALQTNGPRGNFETIYHAYGNRPSPSIYWGDIVEIYSRMSLTIDTDRPIAISGLLDTFRPYLGEYWAGMWQHLLPLHLLWSTRPRLDHELKPSLSYRPDPKRGPSWSWMSLEGAVYYREHCDIGHKDALLSKFLDAEVLSPRDIRLRIRAPMIRATWVDEWAGVIPRALLTLGLRPVFPGMDMLDSRWENKWLLSRFQLGDGNIHTGLCFAFDVASFEKTVRDVALLAICHRGYKLVDGLVLQENADGSFIRLGRFSADEAYDGVFLRGNETEVILV